MINFNGNIQDKAILTAENRSLNYGDALFETCKVTNNRIQFWEDHYFRLMASMRMLRMEIPMHFTLEFLETEIVKLTKTYSENTFRVKLLVFRNDGGLFTPETNAISYIITATALETTDFTIKKIYTVDLFKDYYTNSDLLNTLKTTNKLVNVLASIYAQENALDTCLLINEKKQITEGIAANIFMVNKNTITTPPLSSGCLKGIMRKQIIALIQQSEKYTIKEAPISPFDLQKADELFLSNSIVGIQPISNYRKKSFNNRVSEFLLKQLNSNLDH